MIVTLLEDGTPATTPEKTAIVIPQLGHFMSLAVDNDTDQPLTIYLDESGVNKIKIAAQSVRDSIILEEIATIYVNVPLAPTGTVTIDATDATGIIVQNRVLATKDIEKNQARVLRANERID
jgi:hypothetical protein